MPRGYTFEDIYYKWPQPRTLLPAIVERVSYSLPGDALKNHLNKFGEVKSMRAVTIKGFGLSKFKLEMVLKQHIPSRIMLQGNPLNIFYTQQPRYCFVCRGAGHEAKNCPKQLANKQVALAASGQEIVSNKLARLVEVEPHDCAHLL